MEKGKIGDEVYKISTMTRKIEIPLQSLDKREEFILNITNGKIVLKRRTHQMRARKAIILTRICFNRPHTNPDGSAVGVPHIHIYKEGYGDKWAYEIPKDKFTDLGDYYKTLLDFMDYCNIVNKPNTEKELFL